MSQQFIIENAKGRERLHNLVNNITDKELTTTLYEEGWTIAVALAHLAFWDKRRLVLVRKWKQEGVTPTPVIDEDLINDTLVPFLLAIPPRKAAELATLMAETLDRELEEGATEGSPEAETAPAKAPAPAARPAPRPRPAPAPARPPPVVSRTGTLKVRANRKVLITLNGRPVDYAPLDLPVTPGTYVLGAALPGRPDTEQTKTVDISAGAIERVEFTF